MKGLAAVAAAVILASLSAVAEASGPTRVSGVLSHDVTWDEGGSPYLVEGNLSVQKGAVLTIRPGVSVRFQVGLDGKGGMLVVRGGLLAEGEEGRPVKFSQGSGATGWDGIYFHGSDPKRSTLRRCVVMGGRVTVNDASPVIEQCSLYGSTYALHVAGKSSPTILGNRITANVVGLVLTGAEASPIVGRNNFYNNDYGIVAKDFGSPRVTANVFSGNRKYNLVNQSSKPLPAAWNDFRSADAEAIARTIHDGSKDARFGTVQFRPFMPPTEDRPVRTAAAPKFQSRLCLTLDGGYAYSQGVRVPDGLSSGLGNNLRVEWQFQPFMSIGVNAGYQSFLGQGKVGTAGMLDLMGRVIPFQDKGMEAYFIGGAGMNPLYNRKTTPWIGRWHAMAGVGTRLALDGNWGLDLAGIYNFYTPLARHVDAFSIRMGVGYSFGI